MSSKNSTNLAYLFFRGYYANIKDPEKLNKEAEKDYAQQLERINLQLFGASLATHGGSAWPANADLTEPPFFQFQLYTTYPGLFTGAGTSHETGALGEIKMGFQFDYTSGLPVVAGSTVKGCLRHRLGQLLLAAKEHPGAVKTYLADRCRPFSTLPEAHVKVALEALIQATFAGPAHPYRRDIFFDAFPVESKNVHTRFLGRDFITPHGDNPLKEPTPLQFMKLLPGVAIRFSFRLHDFSWEAGAFTLPAADKKNLFYRLLQDWGLGAKNRNGYGRLKPQVHDWETVQTGSLPFGQSTPSASPPGKGPGKSQSQSQGKARDHATERKESEKPVSSGTLQVGAVYTVRIVQHIQGKKGMRVTFRLPGRDYEFKRTVPDVSQYPIGSEVKVKIHSLGKLPQEVQCEFVV